MDGLGNRSGDGAFVDAVHRALAEILVEVLEVGAGVLEGRFREHGSDGGDRVLVDAGLVERTVIDELVDQAEEGRHDVAPDI